MMAPAAALASLREQLRANARLQLGLWIVAAILAVWALLALSDWRMARLASLGEDTQRLQKVRAVAGQVEWPERARDAAALRAALEAELPVVQTVGLAQAALQTQLGDLARKYPAGLRVQVSPAVEVAAAPGVLRVPATLSAELELVQVQQLVHDLETAPNLIRIESINITNRNKVTVSLDIGAFYRLARKEDARAP